MKKIWIIFMLILLEKIVLYAQDHEVISGQGNYSQAYPETDVLRNLDTDLFHGTLALRIPLYEYKTRYLSLPVYMTYSIPKKDYNTSYHPGWTGWGWRLIAGGYITRNIRGIPDESACDPSGNLVWKHGLYSSPNWDIMEDEFTFNFCGYSGSFFRYKGRWIVHSDAEFWIECLWGANYLGSQASNLVGFILKTPDGKKYYFGKNPDDGNGYSVEQYDPGYSNSTPITWNLSKIESPEGDFILLNYERDEPTGSLIYEQSTLQAKYYAYNNTSPHTTFTKITPNPQDIATKGMASNAFVMTSSYLQSISGGNVNIYFNRSRAIEKNYPSADFKILPPTNVSDKSNYLKWYQLDSIVFEDAVSGKHFKKYQFNYTTNASEPLKLLSIQEQGIQANNTVVAKPAYLFEYGYSLPLKILKGAIVKITYPTGGYSTFEYAYHITQNETGSLYLYSDEKGYRIKRILTYSSEDETPFETEYSYVIPNSNLSSGQLSRNKILSFSTAFNTGSDHIKLNKTSNMDIDIPTTSGNTPQAIKPDPDVYGYTFVTETKRKGSQIMGETRFYFVNYGLNGDLSEIWLDDERTESFAMWYKTGKLVRQESLDGNLPTKQITYDYRDPGRQVDTLIRQTKNFLPISETSSFVKTGFTKQFFTKYLPKRIIETVPNEYGTRDTTLTMVVTRDSYTGNILSEETTDLSGNVYKTEYHFVANIDVFRVGFGVYNRPYETIVWKNGKVIAAEVIQDTVLRSVTGNYYERPVRKYVLETSAPITNYQAVVYKNGAMDARCKLAATYDYYPATGNLKRYQETGKAPIILYWGKHNLPVAEIIGAEYNEIENAMANTSPILKMEPAPDMNPNQFADVQKLRARLTNALITSYTYNQYGLTSVTDPTGRSQYIEYNAFGQPAKMMDSAGNILESIQYNYQINP